VSISYNDQLRKLKSTVESIREDGMLCFMDVVLNHAARNSEFLAEHPEATYNTENCPWLNAAYLLDNAIREFSTHYANS